jgi:purine-binding chemotaxis protein CheW
MAPVGDVQARDAMAPHTSFLTFQAGAEPFGMRLADVSEIIRIPPLAHMPLAPRSLLGLANLRGTVVPVVSLARMLGFEDRPPDGAARIIVVQRGAPVGIAVDRIGGLVTVAADRLEQGDHGSSDTDIDHADGLIKGNEGESTTRIVDPTRLLRTHFAQLGTSRQRVQAASGIAPVSIRARTDTARKLAFVSFDVGTQEYALPLDSVHEIVALPAHISAVARSETAVLGVITLRDRLLPLVSLRTLLGLPQDGAAGARSKVVVLSLGHARVGLVADRTREILRIVPHSIEPAPALLTRGEGDAEVTSICRLEAGRRLVAVLSPDRLFRSDVVRRILADHHDGTSAGQTEQSAMDEEQFVIFRLGAQDYGMPVRAVEEIARRPQHMTPLPRAPKFIDGVINLRGAVIPVIDLRRRFELAAGEAVRSQRILVVALGAQKAGFMVDDVSEIRRVPADAIRPAPELSPEQMRLIGRVANLDADRGEGRMILLVDPEQLLDRGEAGELAKLEDLPLK